MKDTLTGAQIGTLHPDGTVTDPKNLKWTKIDQEHFVSQKLNNGDFDYFLVISVVDLQDACGKDGYLISVEAVSAQALGEEKVKEAMDNNEPTEMMDEQSIAVLLSEYGYHAVLSSNTFSNLRKGVKEAKTQAEAINMMFGFYMDHPQNRIGSTGWDFIRGDMMAALDRPDCP